MSVLLFSWTWQLLWKFQRPDSAENLESDFLQQFRLPSLIKGLGECCKFQVDAGFVLDELPIFGDVVKRAHVKEARTE
jgi:hypothetical protein